MATQDNQINMFQVAEITVSYRPAFKASERPQVTCSKDAYEYFSSGWDLGKLEMIEQFKIMLLNRSNRVLGIVDISTGGVSGTVCDPKVIFAAALKANASNIILAHNHPSGNLKPSDEDVQLTKRLVQAGNILDVQVIEHLIITNDGYCSFTDQGIL